MSKKEPRPSAQKKFYLLIFHGTPSEEAKAAARLIVEQTKRLFHTPMVRLGLIDREDPEFFITVLNQQERLAKKVWKNTLDVTVFPLVLLPGKHYRETLLSLKKTIPYREGRLAIHEPLCALGPGMLLGTPEALSRRKNHAPRSTQSKGRRTGSTSRPSASPVSSSRYSPTRSAPVLSSRSCAATAARS